MSILQEKSRPQHKKIPAWLAPRLAKLRARARAGRIVLPFNDPLIGPAFALLTSGGATVRTDHARKIHVLTIIGEGIQ